MLVKKTHFAIHSCAGDTFHIQIGEQHLHFKLHSCELDIFTLHSLPYDTFHITQLCKRYISYYTDMQEIYCTLHTCKTKTLHITQLCNRHTTLLCRGIGTLHGIIPNYNVLNYIVSYQTTSDGIVSHYHVVEL